MSRTHLNTLRFSILPWVLGALVLRAMIPAGFMHAPGTTLEAAMCSPGAATELIEVPGSDAPVHCDACLIPTLAAPPAAVTGGTPAVAGETVLAHDDAPHSRFALIRSQLARAPPA